MVQESLFRIGISFIFDNYFELNKTLSKRGERQFKNIFNVPLVLAAYEINPRDPFYLYGLTLIQHGKAITSIIQYGMKWLNHSHRELDLQ